MVTLADLRPGDVLLMRGDFFLSRFIVALDGDGLPPGDFDHTAMVTELVTDSAGQVVDIKLVHVVDQCYELQLSAYHVENFPVRVDAIFVRRHQLDGDVGHAVAAAKAAVGNVTFHFDRMAFLAVLLLRYFPRTPPALLKRRDLMLALHYIFKKLNQTPVTPGRTLICADLINELWRFDAVPTTCQATPDAGDTTLAGHPSSSSAHYGLALDRRPLPRRPGLLAWAFGSASWDQFLRELNEAARDRPDDDVPLTTFGDYRFDDRDWDGLLSFANTLRDSDEDTADQAPADDAAIEQALRTSAQDAADKIAELVYGFSAGVAAPAFLGQLLEHVLTVTPWTIKKTRTLTDIGPLQLPAGFYVEPSEDSPPDAVPH